MTQIPVGQVALFRLLPEDDNGTTRAASGTLSISDPTLAYVAKMPGQANQYIVVSRVGIAPPVGTVAPVNVTVATQSDTGVELPPVVIPFQIPGPPLPPPATHIVVSEGPTVRDLIGFTPPPDPGSSSIPL
jgi:hypothetical protein